MALADAAIAIVGAANVVVLTIDHQLHHQSAEVAANVARWAASRNVTAVVRRVTVARGGGGIEAAARRARYGALDELAVDLGLVAILVAHTARDQAETVVMRILRGTGPAGLVGVAARRGVFVRPLLTVNRGAIDDYVSRHHLPVWDDPMNHDPAFARVRVRTAILPALRCENPALDDALLRLAASAREWRDVLDRASEPFARFPIDAPGLAREPAGVRKRALARALDQADIAYDAVHLDALDDLVTAASRGERTVDLPTCTIVRSYHAIAPRRESMPAPRRESTPAPRRESTPATDVVVPPGHELRRWRAGDRMRPARLKGRSRKLSDLFGDAKVPRQLRAQAKVIVRICDGEIVWAQYIGDAFGR